jgi:hypothetical protein
MAHRLDLKAKLVPAGPRTGDVVLRRTVYTTDNRAPDLVTQGTSLGLRVGISDPSKGRFQGFTSGTVTHCGPAMSWNRADALDDAQSLRVREHNLG